MNKISNFLQSYFFSYISNYLQSYTNREQPLKRFSTSLNRFCYFPFDGTVHLSNLMHVCLSFVSLSIYHTSIFLSQFLWRKLDPFCIPPIRLASLDQTVTRVLFLDSFSLFLLEFEITMCSLCGKSDGFVMIILFGFQRSRLVRSSTW